MSEPIVVVTRVALALLFGAMIGIDRERRQKTAGLKTITLVSIGAAGFAIMTNTFGPSNHNPAQLAAAVVGGIGFIGAGVILRRGEMVEGVTTAATLWSASSVGLASGLGYYTIAATLTVAILMVQLVFPYIEKLIRPARRNGTPDGESS